MAAPTIVNISTGSTSSSGAGSTYPSGYTAVTGDLQMLIFVVDSGSTVTPPGGSNWVQILNEAVGGSKLIAYRRWITAGETLPGSFTLSPSTRINFFRFVVRGVDTTQPEDVPVVTQGSTTAGATATAPSLTTVTADALLLTAIFGYWGTAANSRRWNAFVPTMNANNGSNATATADYVARLGREVRATAGATGDRTVTEQTSVNFSRYSGISIALRASGAVEESTVSTLSGDSTLDPPTSSGSLTHAAPVSTLSGGSALEPPSSYGDLARTVPAFTLAGASSLEPPTSAGTVNTGTPSFTVSGGSTLPTPSSSGALTRTVPVYALSGGSSLPAPTSMGNLTRTVPAFTVGGGSTLPAPVSTGALNTGTPSFTLTGTSTLQPPVSTGTVTRTVPAFTIGGGSTLAPPTSTGSLTHTAPTFTISGGSSLAAPTSTGGLNTGAPAFTLAGGSSLAPPTSVGSLTRAAPTFVLGGGSPLTAPTSVGTVVYVAPPTTGTPLPRGTMLRQRGTRTLSTLTNTITLTAGDPARLAGNPPDRLTGGRVSALKES